MPEYVSKPGRGTALEDQEAVELPPRYRVLLHNDHYTTMDFVVLVLEHVFHKPRSEAARIMLNVHENGIGVAGVYVKEVAETKVASVHRIARSNQFPLKCSMEPE